MGKKLFLFFTLVSVFSFKVYSQTFTYRTSLKDMCGVPGDVFSCTISFTNTASSTINIFINRYQKTMPAYWNSCYCYNLCNSPLRDTITISIPAFSTDMVVVQFKTDSVNPGISTSDFKIYQVGFQNNLDSFHLEASTACGQAAGLNENLTNSNAVKLYPNPANDYLKIYSEDILKRIKIYNVLGELLEENIVNDLNEESITLNDYDPGIYIIELYTDKRLYQKRFLKK